jgi:hypothetical protein
MERAMAALNEYDPEMTYDHQDPLVERLRTIEWVQAPDDVRQRCWEQFSRHIAFLEGEPVEHEEAEVEALPGPERRDGRLDERYTFSRRRLIPDHVPVAHAWHRPRHTVALAS